ncbi:alpha/beta hydrolase family protein [Alienimonas sp. DA493]|uniref:alpha/beta hydrolase family protein n=1 Tax=Alienimonas sp. DA493 TaxID=3373605 RepID=UPI0037551EAD
MLRPLPPLPVALLAAIALSTTAARGDDRPADTFPPLKNGRAPATFKELWAGFDPWAEPLEVETLREWEEEGVAMKVVRFRVGVFKGEKATLAAVYGAPADLAAGETVPGLVQIHGGGQYADEKACLTNARRGYATVSIAWAGRISARDYRVGPDEVRLFWDGRTDDPAYRVTTDWGAVDGYHAPGRNPGNAFPSAEPAAWTLDAVESPRNSGWFLAATAARRALTYLESRPEVDAGRLGVYGHSMGGKLTVMTAVDDRVKAAAPSCGGISDRDNASPLFRATLGDDASLKHVECPIFFLSPANDFHGRIGDLPRAISEIGSDEWRATCSPHRNHQDAPEYEVATQLWFDEHLKGAFVTPETPRTILDLTAAGGTPTLTVEPDRSRTILAVDVYYTQDGKPDETPADRDDVVHRYWRHAEAVETAGRWTAPLPLASTDAPLWAYANVLYALDEPVTGAGYYYGTYTTDRFNLSSLLTVASPESLRENGVRPTLARPAAPGPVAVETFEPGWEREWFTNAPERWGRTTNKLSDEIYAAPAGARLTLDVRSERANELVVRLDDHVAVVPVRPTDGGWQTASLSPGDFQTVDGEALAGWSGVRQLELNETARLRGPRGGARSSRVFGRAWQGAPPRFRNLRWEVPEAPEAEAAPPRDGSALLDVFPPPTATVAAERRGETRFVETFTATDPALWDERLDEHAVFHLEMRHDQRPENSFRLRLGRGGQIYSLQGPFGESVPPSWRAPGGKLSPWNDEVWQFVAVCTRYNGLAAVEKAGDVPPAFARALRNSGYSDTFFIHNSGAYVPGDVGAPSLYCPLLAADYDEDTRTARMLNWGLVPQLKTIHRSPLLYYTQVRDAGDGVIELTWVVHHFGDREDVVFDHLNAPWGGTRVSSLPVRRVSSPTGELLRREGLLSEHGTIDVRKTGGWNLSSASEAADSPSLALVFGRDKHLEEELARRDAGEPYVQFRHSLYRDWRASEPLYETRWRDWAERPANSFRNYDVCEIIPKLRIVPDSTIWFRSYLVVGSRDEVRRQAAELAAHVDYGLLRFPRESTVRTTVSLPHRNVAPAAAFELYAKPVPGSRPLFLIANRTTGEEVVTADPYAFVESEPLSLNLPAEHPHADYFAEARGYSLAERHSDWRALLGYALVERPKEPGWRPLSQALRGDRLPKMGGGRRDLWVYVGPQEDASPR